MRLVIFIVFGIAGVASVTSGVIALRNGIDYFPHHGRSGGGTPGGRIVVGVLFLLAALFYGLIGDGKKDPTADKPGK